MNRIITIGREFGSGGRELALKLAERLQIAYYDREIITEIAKKTSLAEQYVQQVVERRPSHWFPLTTGYSFYLNVDPLQEQNLSIYQEQCRIIKEMAAKSDVARITFSRIEIRSAFSYMPVWRSVWHAAGKDSPRRSNCRTRN